MPRHHAKVFSNVLPALVVMVACGGAAWPRHAAATSTDSQEWVAAAKKKKKKKAAAATSGKTQATPVKAQPPQGKTTLDQFDLSSPPPAPAAPAGGDAGILDLSAPTSEAATEKAKQELLQGPAKPKPKEKHGKAGKGSLSFDFGGGAAASGDAGGGFDFGSEEQSALNLGGVNVQSAEHDRFEAALSMMSDEDYGKASLEFKFFLSQNAYVEFHQESEYQLGKALYQLGFLEAALKQFQAILEQGPTHKRYRKAVEWLFFMSRRTADQTPVLAQLARFRNVSFPKAYRNEYNYLLAKYLFVQADNFEVKRIQDEELARGKKSKEATLDFGAIANAIESPKSDSMDFSSIGGAGALDFGASGGGESLDFGAGSNPGLDFGGAVQSGGGLDFGGGAPTGSGLDFGAPAPDAGGGLDFGGPAAPAADKSSKPMPTKSAAPTNAKEAVKQGLELVAQVAPESTFYPRAKYLEGLLQYIVGDDQKAVAAFQEVVRVLNPREGARLDPKLREMAFLSLARIHYGHKQFNRSVYYYDLIDRDSENWLTALFEASWAHYRRGDFEKALGNLLTLHSPFFEREYFPESQIVKAVIYFEACRYPETRRIVDDFIKRYTALMHAIQKISESTDAPEMLYEKIVKMQDKAREEDDEVTARVVNLTLNDTEIRTGGEVLHQLRAQQKTLADMSEKFRQSGVGSDLSASLAQANLDGTKQAGMVTRKKFEQELYRLKGLLAQALRIKIEVARSEREGIEKRVQGGATGNDLVQAEARTVVDDEHVYWPYEGEYWRDELGTYELDFSMCRQVAAE